MAYDALASSTQCYCSLLSSSSAGWTGYNFPAQTGYDYPACSPSCAEYLTSSSKAAFQTRIIPTLEPLVKSQQLVSPTDAMSEATYLSSTIIAGEGVDTLRSTVQTTVAGVKEAEREHIVSPW